MGPFLKYITTRNVSGGGSYNGKVTRKAPEYTAVMEHEVTVVSKRLVKVNQKVLRGGIGNVEFLPGTNFHVPSRKNRR